MDRPLDPSFRRRRTRARVLVVAAALSLASAVFAWGPGLIRPTVSRSRILTAVVESGVLEAVITASGTVVPEVEQAIASPAEARVLKVLKRPGDVVKRGDPILQMDVQALVLAAEKAEQDLVLKGNQQARAGLDLERRLNDVESQAEIKRLQLEQSRSQLRRHRLLAEQGLISDEALRASELAEAQAAIELRKIEAEGRHARRAADSEREGLRLEMATLGNQRNEARRQLELATTQADVDGVVTWVVGEEGASVRRGDTVARVADLASFRVQATVSDVHAQRLGVGLPATVRISDRHALAARVSGIDPTIREGVMTFWVELTDKSSPLLRSNLRVDVLVVTGRKERTLRIRRGASVDGEGLRDVFVVRGDRAVRTPVRLGRSSFDHVEVVEGLQEGDEAVISDMGDFAAVRELRVR